MPSDGRCEITLNGNGTSSYIAALRIGGRLLVDTGVDGLGVNKLIKETTYSTTLTCASDKDLDHCFVGAAFMTNESGNGP